jgi:cellulose synthase/poly-beta-1,6-N-acetylglucosamine synthase-like glycosyltransferase
MQCTDWLIGLGMVKVASTFGKPVTTLGSNMMVSRGAYKATGGYENMPFSITEDYALLHHTFRQGFGFQNVMDASVLAESLPVASVRELLQQRVRWMHGAMQLSYMLIMLLFIIAFFYPLLVFIAFSKPWMALGLFFLKIGTESVFAGMVMQQLNLGLSRKKKLFATFLLYEFCAAILSISMIVLYFLSMKIRWKGRIFQ